MKYCMYLFIGLLNTVLMLMACNNSSWYKDDFYNNAKVDAFKRLPLSKPYELINDGLGWELKFVHDRYLATRVDHIYIKESNFIIGYGNNGEVIIGGKDTLQRIMYFLIDVKNKKEHIYTEAGINL